MYVVQQLNPPGAAILTYPAGLVFVLENTAQFDLLPPVIGP